MTKDDETSAQITPRIPISIAETVGLLLDDRRSREAMLPAEFVSDTMWEIALIIAAQPGPITVSKLISLSPAAPSVTIRYLKYLIEINMIVELPEATGDEDAIGLSASGSGKLRT